MAIPKDHDPIRLYLLEARQKLAETLHDCLITDLSTIETFIQLSEYWYQNGGRSHGEQLKREAEKGILTIRNHLSTTTPLRPDWREEISRRCNELECALTRIQTARCSEG